MKKLILIILVGLGLILPLTGCVGDTNQSITATITSGNNSCSAMTNGSQCVIQLNYANTGGSLTYSSSPTNPLPSQFLGGGALGIGSFTSTFANCQTQVSNNNLQPCSIIITYAQGSTPPLQQNIVFSLGGASTSAIVLGGD